jgi:hypothetical protein
MPDSTPLPSRTALVRVPVVLSLAVLALRLVGEQLGWDPRFFPREGGPTLSPIGIWLLIPIVGFVQGFVVAGSGHAPDRPGLALLLHGLGAAFLAAAMVVGTKTLEWPMQPVAAGIGALLAIAFAWRAWPELLRYGFAYGLWTRLGVTAVTVAAVLLDWGTHLEQVAAESGVTTTQDRLLLLASVQLLFWLPATVVIGGAAGSLAAILRGRRSDDAIDE